MLQEFLVYFLELLFLHVFELVRTAVLLDVFQELVDDFALRLRRQLIVVVLLQLLGGKRRWLDVHLVRYVPMVVFGALAKVGHGAVDEVLYFYEGVGVIILGFDLALKVDALLNQ